MTNEEALKVLRLLNCVDGEVHKGDCAYCGSRNWNEDHTQCTCEPDCKLAELIKQFEEEEESSDLFISITAGDTVINIPVDEAFLEI